ncbi:unnamed protein product [Peniophora sp. CBMAI 1063]|nr:unnamed protein product [Peniophora sp. CBMAI 1063]
MTFDDLPAQSSNPSFFATTQLRPEDIKTVFAPPTTTDEKLDSRWLSQLRAANSAAQLSFGSTPIVGQGPVSLQSDAVSTAPVNSLLPGGTTVIKASVPLQDPCSEGRTNPLFEPTKLMAPLDEEPDRISAKLSDPVSEPSGYDILRHHDTGAADHDITNEDPSVSQDPEGGDSSDKEMDEFLAYIQVDGLKCDSMVAQDDHTDAQNGWSLSLDMLLKEKVEESKSNAGPSTHPHDEDETLKDVESATRLAMAALSSDTRGEDVLSSDDMVHITAAQRLTLLGEAADRIVSEVDESEYIKPHRRGITIWQETSVLSPLMDIDELTPTAWSAFVVYSRATDLLGAALPYDDVDWGTGTLMLPALSLRWAEASDTAFALLQSSRREIVVANPRMPLSASLIIQALHRLGLKPETCTIIGLPSAPLNGSIVRDKDLRENMLKKILTLVRDYVEAGAIISPSDISQITLIVLILATDIDSPSWLRSLSTSALDGVLGHFHTGTGPASHDAATLANKIWILASMLPLSSQRAIVAAFGFGNESSKSICRCLAYHLLLDRVLDIDNAALFTEPQLASIRQHLYSAGALSVNADTDFHVMEAKLDILDKALIGTRDLLARAQSTCTPDRTTAVTPNTVDAFVKMLQDIIDRLGVVQSLIRDSTGKDIQPSIVKSRIKIIQSRLLYIIRPFEKTWL